MQEVSQAWKDAQKLNFVPESYVEVTLSVTDPEMDISEAEIADNGHEGFSNVEQTIDGLDKEPVKYATLERNMWVLDGTFALLPSSAPYGDNGFVGNVLSGDDGTYASTPTITISFPQVLANLIPGITITWATAYDEWASSFRVTAYYGTQVVQQQTVTDNTSTRSVVLMDISGYDKITVEVLKWCLPGRRARMEELLIGIEKTYSKSEIMSYSHESSVNPLSAELPKNEISFEVVNLNGEYNPDNPSGAEKYLMERQSITVRYGYKLDGKVEWIKAGTFFMSEWDTPQNGITATFTARNLLEYMTDTYTGPNSGTLFSIAKSALEQADLPIQADGSVRWYLDSSLSKITAPGDLDLSKYTLQEVVQYVANAGCCVFYQDRNGVLHLEPLADGTTDYVIDQFISYENSEISLTKQLKAVNVNNGQYILEVGTAGETQPISNPLISDTQAPAVAKWAADYLVNRKTLSGEFRADPRLDPLDRIQNVNQFAETVVLVTEIKYTYGGSFRGSYEGRTGV
jgi:hypothetical protein